MWDESLVPSINYTGEGCLALPELNLQFLTLHDYFLRNFNIFSLESTYEIREDIQEAVPHLLAYINNEGQPAFRGWSRMAVPVKEFKITEVEQPNIGEVKPAAVTAEVTFTISSYKSQISAEEAANATVQQRLGLHCVRGCEIIEMRDEEGILMNDFTGRIKWDEWKPPKETLELLLLHLTQHDTIWMLVIKHRKAQKIFMVCFVDQDGLENLQPSPPFKIKLPRNLKGKAHALPGSENSNIASADAAGTPEVHSERDKLIVEAQVGAITSGVQPGLSMVVGPPGTGKTDTAVQVLNVLYHNCPSQRTLIITHSNQYLNDLSDKIMQSSKSVEQLNCSTVDRSNYLMTKQAKIVAMTCTHAALKRNDFLQVGFKYDDPLMEESAQILEIETFIPMLLQRQEDGYARFKCCILIGDHHQLPPGRARLYNWRYRKLGDLPYVKENAIFHKANDGFSYDYQLVDVPDYNGRGESAPSPWFYQNEGEAEYIVSVYMYMQLLGYPANKISTLTTYNGQKLLIRDVVNRRRVPYDFIGAPHKLLLVARKPQTYFTFSNLSSMRPSTTLGLDYDL
ncbi:hypothetical protein RDI58_017761 [Solanum bulbocastanum]|uniref:Uncharacterized protein n=1 Tax=Solanum bulbocastanum TaxID=147425 RepID=A0AAN8TF80_SOLBU